MQLIFLMVRNQKIRKFKEMPKKKKNKYQKKFSMLYTVLN